MGYNGIVAFDADGTLTDTLPSHVLFCRDMNARFGYGLSLPDPQDTVACKKLAGNPMAKLLANAGFFQGEIPKLLQVYKDEFGSNPRYASKPFPGVPEMLSRLKEQNRYLAIVSSNHRTNIKRDLGEENFALFNSVLDKTDLDLHHQGNKGIALNYLLLHFDNSWPGCLTFVGDMESDYRAARAVKCRFFGFAPGWGIAEGEERFPVAKNVEELEKMLSSLPNFDLNR